MSAGILLITDKTHYFIVGLGEYNIAWAVASEISNYALHPVLFPLPFPAGYWHRVCSENDWADQIPDCLQWNDFGAGWKKVMKRNVIAVFLALPVFVSSIHLCSNWSWLHFYWPTTIFWGCFFLSFIFDEICVLGKVQVLHKTVFLYLFFLYFGADAIFPSFLLFCLILLCFFFAFLSPSLPLFFSVCLLWEIAPSPFRQACVALPSNRICGISLKTCFQRDSKMALNVSVLLQSVILCHMCIGVLCMSSHSAFSSLP